MNRAAGPSREQLTLGLLAGGQASRLGGRDKAWLTRDGMPQVLRLAARFAASTSATLVSANKCLPRYAAAGLDAIPDQLAGHGPLSGLHALAAACQTPWLFTLPVDVTDAGEPVLAALAGGCNDNGAWLRDADGPQPLAAVWRVDALRGAVEAAMEAGDVAIQGLHVRLSTHPVELPGLRLGNLNTPADLVAAGMDAEAPAP